MKSIFNISKGFLSVAILSAAFVSCSEDKMDSINNDNNHTTVVPSKFILADVLTSTAFNNVGGDFNTYFASYVEHEVGISNQLYRAETRTGEPSSSTTFNNVWENTYSVLKNARIIVHKCSEDGDQHGNYTTRGIGEVMVALNSGLIAGTLVNVAGASDVLNEGYVTYSNEAKERLIHVSHETLETYGAVSEQTAHEMAEGAAKAANADAALSATGIAGPGGGTEEKPVGLVYIGCYLNGKTTVKECRWNGSRMENRLDTVNAALEMLKERLMEEMPV